MDPERAAKVTEGQRACLRMVLQHMSSKDIARALGISPHTVDQRLRVAMRLLGASSRVEAARMIAAPDGSEPHEGTVYQRPVYQPREMDLPPRRGSSRASAPAGGRPSGPQAARGEEGDGDGVWAQRRFGWIVAVVAGAAVTLAGLLTALQALSTLTR